MSNRPKAITFPNRADSRPHDERSYVRERQTQREASVEIQRRLSFPFACISFALLAMPIGARPRRGGRAAGFLITLLLITGYYLMFTIGAGLARQGTIPIWAGIWSANVITAGLGLYLLPRLERMPASSSRTSAAFDWQWRVWKIFSETRSKAVSPPRTAQSQRGLFPGRKGRTGFPNSCDVYLLRSFVYYFVLLTVGFILLFEVSHFLSCWTTSRSIAPASSKSSYIFSISPAISSTSSRHSPRSCPCWSPSA